MQQEIMCIKNNEVIVQSHDYGYYDTLENFLKDGFTPPPAGLNSVDYNRTLQVCIFNGELQENWFNEYCEGVLDQLAELREKIEQRRYEAVLEQAQKDHEEHIKAITLDQFKQERLKELDRISARFEDNLNKDMYFISSNGFKCNGDRRTKSNIQDIITFFDLQANDGRVMYRDYDNVERSLDKAQVQTLLIEHVANGNALYSQKWTLQEKIRAAKTKDALKKLKLDFVMSDFNKQPVSI